MNAPQQQTDQPRLCLEATPITPGCAVVAVHGEVALSTMKTLGECVAELVEGGVRHLILDLEHADIAHVGLQLIARLLRDAVSAGCAIALAHAHEPTARALRFTGLDNVVSIYGTVTEALADAPIGNEHAR